MKPSLAPLACAACGGAVSLGAGERTAGVVIGVVVPPMIERWLGVIE